MTPAEKLVQEFSVNVRAQTDALEQGDWKTGNKHAKRYIRAFSKLREMGPGGRDALAVLLRADRIDVRGAAAAFLLRHRTEEALEVLHELARGQGLAAFEAGETLKRWEEGSWALDPEPGKESA